MNGLTPLSRSIYRGRLAVGVGILLLLGFGLLTLWSVSRRASPPSIHREAGLNVLLITIDTLRADAVGAYGQPGGITPWIDRLAAAGGRFTNARAHNVVTLPSHANILAGRLPGEHGVRDNAGFRFPSGLDTLATLLKSQGYDTGAFVSAFPLESRFGLARGFDVYDDRFADAARPAFLIQERSGRDTVASALRWLESQRDSRWFCWVHLYEPHVPYAPPEPFASRFRNEPYHGEVAATDAFLTPLLEPLVSAGRNGRTLVVLTSDHGESLGDHGEATHGVFAYEATLKVPLVFYQPRLFQPVVVDTAAQHVDVLPTVLDALALAVPPGLPGRSLLPDMAGEKDQTVEPGHVLRGVVGNAESPVGPAPWHRQGWSQVHRSSGSRAVRLVCGSARGAQPRGLATRTRRSAAHAAWTDAGPPRDCRSPTGNRRDARTPEEPGVSRRDRQQPDSALRGGR